MCVTRIQRFNQFQQCGPFVIKQYIQLANYDDVARLSRAKLTYQGPL